MDLIEPKIEVHGSPPKQLNGSSSETPVPVAVPSSDTDQKPSVQNGEIKNGHHEKKHKDKHKDKKHKHHKHDKDRDRDRDKDRHSSSSKDKDRKSSSSTSDKHKSESRDKSPDKNKIKSESSSSVSKDVTKETSSSSSSSKHKSKHKDKSRDKDRSRDKEREKDRDRKSSSMSQSPEKSRPPPPPPVVEVKPEPVSPVKVVSAMPLIEGDDSDDDVPLALRRATVSPKKEVKVEKEESESEDEDDVPLMGQVDYTFTCGEKFIETVGLTYDSARKKVSENGTKKRKVETDSEDDIPLSQRKSVKKIKSDPVKKESSSKKVTPKKRARSESESESEYNSDYSDKVRNKKKPKKGSSSRKSSTSKTPARKSSAKDSPSPTKKGGRKVKEEPEEVWEWWKEAPREDGVKWNFLEHKGPVFAPDYEPLPKDVKFRYNGKSMRLSPQVEEVAGFYSRFIEHDYTTKEMFNKNFFKDWRRLMTESEKETITDLKKCDFREINEYFKKKAEERKAMSKEEKLAIKEENEELLKKYGICIVDGHKEKIGNFRIEPPGLFRGRGEHPKMGMLKNRIIPEDVVVNCSKDSNYPEPPKGHKWKEIRHDNTVSWLACWTENVQGQPKYVMLNPSSRLKGEKDWMKYEKARELAKKIDRIRENYKNDFKSKEMRIRQRAVAMYFIDKLALRAGNEKDEDQADTVGCCSLRYEHIKLHEEKGGLENVVVFDFLGKDSIRYYNEVPIDKRVFKNLKIFMQNKKSGDDLFDRLNTAILNKHLSELMDGLSAKVFRTYNASHTLQEQLDELTPKKGTVAEKVLAYNRANRAVAILCNHQRAAPKSHEKSMENLEAKIQQKKADVKDAKKELKGMKKGSKDYEKKQAALKRLEEALAKMEMNKTDKEEGKEIALGTSKLNYLDPRITVAWCKKYDVPIEKAYNKTQRSKFRWAIDMADKTYRFD